MNQDVNLGAMGVRRRTQANLFRALGAEIANLNITSHNYLRQYRAHFGITPLKTALLYDIILEQHERARGILPEHLMWALLQARTYNREEILAAMAGTTEKTYREKSWDVLEILCNLNLIDWERRKVRCIRHNRCMVTVDGTDFRIKEQFPFDSRWYSHKYNGPGVRYEFAISIATGWIVRVYGPFPCGDWPDLRIARHELIYILEPGEYYIADKGYRDGYNWCYSPTGDDTYADRQIAALRARHENVNRRIKEWGAMQQKWRHPIEKHGIMLGAIANIVQLGLETDAPLRYVHYDEREFGEDFLLN